MSTKINKQSIGWGCRVNEVMFMDEIPLAVIEALPYQIEIELKKRNINKVVAEKERMKEDKETNESRG